MKNLQKENILEKTQTLKVGYTFNFKQFVILIKMLLQDKLKINFKSNVKQSIIKIVSLVACFVILTAVSYTLYYIVELLHLFSVFSYIPLSVPSFISTVVFIISFITLVAGINKVLYYSVDNRIMITYPCKGSTIFFARLTVYYINELIRNFIIQIPLFLGYMIVMSFPLVMILWLIFGLMLITTVEVLLASLLSIPTYYVSRFLKRYAFIKTIVYVVIFLGILGAISYVLYLIPDSLDIYTNWGPYFTRVQAFLRGYTTYLSPFYYLTQFLIGKLDLFNVTLFTLNTLYVFLVLSLSIILLYLICMFVINPIYFKLATDSFEFESDELFLSKKTKKRTFLHSQLHKEFLLFFKDPGYCASIIGSFVFLPLMLTILNKIYGAMNVNAFGNRIVACANILLILVVSLSTNSAVAKSYSSEGGAFEFNRVYPRDNVILLLSKNIIPFGIGLCSILSSCIIFGVLKDIEASKITLMFISILLIYLGHMLFASQLDFCSITSMFSLQGKQSKAQLIISITAFVIPAIIVFLFFLYISDDSFTAYIKLLVLALLVFAVFLWVYIKKIKFIYQEGA